jgi:hypothetical protein
VAALGESRGKVLHCGVSTASGGKAVLVYDYSHCF